MRETIACIILAGFILVSGALHAQEKEPPINITADRMEADTKTNTVTFSGHVVAKQKDMTITGDLLVAVYGDGQKELKEVHVSGNVKITQQDKIAVADDALMINAERKIILTGNPKVWQGDDVIAGEKIVYYMDQNKTAAEGGSKRVRVVIHPKKKEDAFANPTGKGAD